MRCRFLQGLTHQRCLAVAEDPTLRRVSLAEVLAKCSHDMRDKGNELHSEDAWYLVWEARRLWMATLEGWLLQLARPEWMSRHQTCSRVRDVGARFAAT
jgi:hypothetical protein